MGGWRGAELEVSPFSQDLEEKREEGDVERSLERRIWGEWKGEAEESRERMRQTKGRGRRRRRLLLVMVVSVSVSVSVRDRRGFGRS